MNILYYSVHAVLEDDELRILRSAGHSVCSIGTRTNSGVQSPLYRLPVIFSALEQSFYTLYEELGGQYHAPADSPDFIPEGFAEHFDIIIVMHQFHIIQSNWKKLRKLKRRTVIWRTIGQDMIDFERYLGPFRQDGLKIVRYSPIEAEVPNTLGSDAVIRFAKRPDQYEGWHGSSGKLLTFVNSFEARYPDEARNFREVSQAIPAMVGGASNQPFDNWLGFISLEGQISCYQTCGVYLYLAGLTIPYTLNFIEAWMVGAPMVVFAPPHRRGPFFEIDRLITDGKDGFVCTTLSQTIAMCRLLINDKALAARTGELGRKTAVMLFGEDKVSGQWRDLLGQLEAGSP